MTKAFNLLDEPWLPVRLQDGEVKELGLHDLFKQASQIVALADTAPPALIAQYRLLLAITHRALSEHQLSWGQRDLHNWFAQGLPTQAITDYLERRRERFWLFHPEYPFMQVAALATAIETADKLKPWTKIDLASTSGNAAVVFNHSLDGQPRAISSSRAIRSLLGFLQCTPGGLVKVFRDADKAGPLANTAAIMPLGGTLAQTLILGLHPASPKQADLPSWERARLMTADLKAVPIVATGPNDRYTRQTRAVLFQPEEDGTIRWLCLAAGQGLEEIPHAPDPMASFRVGNAGPERLTFSQERALWRDLPALLPEGGEQNAIPAAILDGATRLNKSMGGKHLRFLVAGLASYQAKLLRWRVEQLELPQVIFEQAEATRMVRHLLEMTHILFASIQRAAVQLIADTLPNSQQKDTRSRARALFEAGPIAPLFFTRAERALMTTLALIEHDPDAAQRAWQRVLREAALTCWEALLTSQGGGARLWRANAKAEPRLLFAIKEQLAATNCIGDIK